MLQKNKRVFLLSIVVVSCSFFGAGYYLGGYSDEIVVDFSPFMRIRIENAGASGVNPLNWKMRFPPGTTIDQKKPVSDFDVGDSIWLDFMVNEAIPPYSSVEKNVEFHVQQFYPQLAESLAHLNVSDIDHQLLSEKIDSSPIELTDVSDWVHSMLEYTGHMAQAKTIDQVIEYKRGDCTEFALLAYYRLKLAGYKDVIPVEGYYLGTAQKIDGGSEHAWLLVLDDQQWWVLDPLYKTLQRPSREYLVMNRLEEGVSQPVTRNVTLPIKVI